MNYTEPLVRDLAWALFSPPLLHRSDPDVRWLENDWFGQISRQYTEALGQLDKDPRRLRDAVEGRKDPRLGSYFETLWHFWLGDNPRYQLLFANLTLRSASGTLGEFDLLVRDSKTAKTLHWELAVKFYLGTGDTSQPSNWLGPAQRDRLDVKTDRLLDHQSRLSRYPEANELFDQLGIRVDQTWLILKGRLFYPASVPAPAPHGANPDHLRGFWITPEALASLEGAWLPLERSQWLAPVAQVEPAVCLDNRALTERWQNQPPEYPVCLARVVNGLEVERGFVVTDGWNSRLGDRHQQTLEVTGDPGHSLSDLT